MTIFLDTNVLLDLVQDRVGAEDARRIIGISQENAWTRLYVSYLSMANILLHKPLYPEVLQDTPNQALTVAHQMESFLSQTEQSRTSFLEGADALKQLLSSHSTQTLVDWLESLLLTSTEAMTLDAELKDANPKA